jgi:hypothetical protein
VRLQLSRQAVPEALQADFLYVIGLAPTLLDELLKIVLRPRPPMGTHSGAGCSQRDRMCVADALTSYPARLLLAAASAVHPGVQPEPDAGTACRVRWQPPLLCDARFVAQCAWRVMSSTVRHWVHGFTSQVSPG